MAKYKICPVCGEHNEPIMLECFKCETDLSGVRVLDEENEKALQTMNCAVAKKPVSKRMVRICDCGVKNSIQNRKCESCREDISMVVPTPDTDESQQRYVLTSLDGSYAYEIKVGNTVIGREYEMKDYLQGKSYVSRKHAELNLQEGKLFIKNYSGTNYTYINTKKIDIDESRELQDGDEIGLGGNSQGGERQDEAAYFVIRIDSCM